MRNLKMLIASAAVLSLSAVPVLANSAGALSLSRAVTSSKKDSELAPGILIGVIATVAIVGGAIILSDGDDESDSN